MQLQKSLSPMFEPKAIAIISDSDKTMSQGETLAQTLKKHGFTGKIYPLTATRQDNVVAISNTSIPAFELPIDLAIICSDPQNALKIILLLEEYGTKAAVVMNAEMDDSNRTALLLEEDIRRQRKELKIKIIGPNCLGFLNTHKSVNLFNMSTAPLQGGVGFFAQSASLCIGMLTYNAAKHTGFSTVLHLGNKAMIGETEALAYMSEDTNTTVISGCIENLRNGEQFFKQALITSRKKPVILLRSGVTSAGAKSSSSQRGLSSGFDIGYDTAFKQSGIIRVHRLYDLFTLANDFSIQPLPLGPGVAILTNGSGPGTIAADACEASGLTMSKFGNATMDKLKCLLPKKPTIFNPVDVGEDDDGTKLSSATCALLDDKEVNSLLIVLNPFLTAINSDKIVALLGRLKKSYPTKPIFFSVLCGAKESNLQQAIMLNGFPCHGFPESALRSLSAMYKFALWKNKPRPVQIAYRRDLPKAREIVSTAMASGVLEMSSTLVQELMHTYEVPALKTKLARTSDEAVQIAKQFGQRVALKISSPQIDFRTDVGGVVLDLDTPAAIRSAFMDITSRAKRIRRDIFISGCIVQAMAPKGAREVVVGFRRDARFGPIVFLGPSGEYFDAVNSISHRIAPLSLDDASEMVREVKAYSLMTGKYAEKGINVTALEDIILIMAQIAIDFPEIQVVECNPVMVSDKSAMISKARVTLSKESYN